MSMHLTLRELLKRLPRYLVMVNPSKIMGESGDWQNLSAHNTVIEALRQCSGYMVELKIELGVQLTSMEADPQIEPWIVVVDRVESRTVVWVTDSQLHVADGSIGEVAPLKPGEATAPIPSQLLHQASSPIRTRNQLPEPDVVSFATAIPVAG
jgi:hypothetical protein